MTMPRFVLPVILFCALPLSAEAALLYLEPSSGTHGYGDTFIVNVRIDNEDECINAAEVELDFPKETLRAVDFSRGGSILSLWVEEPVLDNELGRISFAGGVPGGYCGRIRGDPAQSNILGKVVFTAIDKNAVRADLGITIASRVYLNDGQGTRADLTTNGASFVIEPDPLASENPWLAQVDADEIPPDPFVIEVQSTRGVFSGRYYAVFATQDKQSGLDHYEIFERGGWLPVTSPHNLRDQSLSDVRVKAIDKAGNERMGEYIAGSAPERVRPLYLDYVPFAVVIVVFLILAAGAWYMRRLHQEHVAPPAPQV